MEEQNSNTIELTINNVKQDFAKKKLVENRAYISGCSFAKAVFNDRLIIFCQVLF